MAKNTLMANSAQIPANQSQHSCLLWNWRWDKQRELEGWNGCPEGTSGMWSSHGSTPPAQDQLLLPPCPTSALPVASKPPGGPTVPSGQPKGFSFTQTH